MSGYSGRQCRQLPSQRGLRIPKVTYSANPTCSPTLPKRCLRAPVFSHCHFISTMASHLHGVGGVGEHNIQLFDECYYIIFYCYF